MLRDTDIRIASSDASAGMMEAGASWQRAIVVMPGYLASARSEGIGGGSAPLRFAGQMWLRLTSAAFQAHVRLYRDFYANPRSVEYMTERVGEFLAGACPDAQVDLLKMQDLDLTTRDVPWARNVQAIASADPSALRDALRSFLDSPPPDIVLLVHPDAIGLGQEPIEDAVLQHYSGSVLVLNGRRRVYSLTSSRRRRLRRHRFLVETRIIETGLAWYLRIMAVLYATLDRATGARRT